MTDLQNISTSHGHILIRNTSTASYTVTRL